MAFMAETKLPTTADELLRLPREQRFELVRGEAWPVSPAGWHHGAAVAPITAHLVRHVQAANLGFVLGAETGFMLTREPAPCWRPTCPDV